MKITPLVLAESAQLLSSYNALKHPTPQELISFTITLMATLELTKAKSFLELSINNNTLLEDDQAEFLDAYIADNFPRLETFSKNLITVSLAQSL